MKKDELIPFLRLFILILARILYGEVKELLPAVATGLDGIMNYLQPWNVVDWLTIVWGVLCHLEENFFKFHSNFNKIYFKNTLKEKEIL